ncbi:unnamed protein product [Absidia cylindrospora]
MLQVSRLVECYSNLLLLSDGSPICEKCSYNCKACDKTIKDEAIMAGDRAYHADCFRCIQCHTKIDDLIFTQTNKGIFCTHCHESRKQLRQRRKEDKQRQQQRSNEVLSSERFPNRGSDQSSSSDDYKKNRSNIVYSDLDINTSMNIRQPPPIVSRQISTNSILNEYVDPAPIPLVPSSTINEEIYQQKQATASELSMQELIELNNMLNVAIQSGMTDENIPSPPLETYDLLDLPTSSNTKSDTQNLHRELERTKAKLFNVETKFDQIKDISRKALDEYSKMKEHFDGEIAARQSAEEKVTKLQNELSFYHHLNLFGATEFVNHSRDELAQLHKVKTHVEKSINDLRTQRDTIFGDIDRQKHTHWDRFSFAQQQQLTSLQNDTDHAQLGYNRLVKARDDIIAEMILLNNKNAELSNLNNDLSRRMSEREREAMAFMAGTNFLPEESSAKTSGESSSGRPSLDQPKLTAQRNSFTDAVVAAAPRKFKFGRNRSKSSGGDPMIGLPYDTNIPVSAEKSQEGQLRVGNHLFNHTKFLRPSKCDVCGEKMWRGNELKCQECHSVCHVKCVYRTDACQRKSMPDSSNTDGQHKVSIFGHDLIKQVQMEDKTIPRVVRKCIEAVEQRGMDDEGIYRKSGGAGQIRSIQQAFESGDDIDLCDDDQWNDICAVTSVLKQYFRDLPNPLFTLDHHEKWIEATFSSDVKTKADAYQKLLHTIPVEHFDTLKYLMQHLARINSRNDENRMTARNLAVVFGPTLMRHQDENQDLMEMQHKIGCIEFMLNHMDIFDGPIPVPNRSAPLPARKNSLPSRHRRDASIGMPALTFPSRDKSHFI